MPKVVAFLNRHRRRNYSGFQLGEVHKTSPPSPLLTKERGEVLYCTQPRTAIIVRCLQCFSTNVCLVENTSPLVQNTSLFVHNTSLFVHNTSLFVHNTSLFVHNTSLFVHNTSLFVQNTSLFVQNTSCLVHNGGVLPFFNSRQINQMLYLAQDCNFCLIQNLLLSLSSDRQFCTFDLTHLIHHRHYIPVFYFFIGINYYYSIGFCTH